MLLQARMRTKRNKPAAAGDPWPLALRMLGRRDYSVAELSRRLQERGVDRDRVREVVDRCLDCGYLDDARYAAQRARELMREGRAVGPRILADLRHKGIDTATAETALEQARQEHSDTEVLARILERRFPDLDYAGATERERRRVVHYLQRKGFPLNCIFEKLTEKG